MHAEDRLNTVAVLSRPRFGPAAHFDCHADALSPLGINVIKVGGAFWYAGLETVMEQVVDHGAEYVLVLDFDTLFTPLQVVELHRLMYVYPHADAIASLQMRRDGDFPILRAIGEDGYTRSEFTDEEQAKELFPVEAAHFGLTLLRCSRLKHLLHPWFLGVPDKTGRWGAGRVDPDVYFWQHWRASGRTLFVAPGVPVGHAEYVATWPNPEWHSVHQPMREWHEFGMPETAARLIESVVSDRLAADTPVGKT